MSSKTIVSGIIWIASIRYELYGDIVIKGMLGFGDDDMRSEQNATLLCSRSTGL